MGTLTSAQALKVYVGVLRENFTRVVPVPIQLDVAHAKPLCHHVKGPVPLLEGNVPGGARERYVLGHIFKIPVDRDVPYFHLAVGPGPDEPVEVHFVLPATE